MPEWMYLHKSCRQSTRSTSFSLKLTYVPVSSVLQNVYPPELLFPDTVRAGERKETDFAVFGLTALIYQYLYGYFTSHRFCVDRPRFLCRYPDFSDVKLFCHTRASPVPTFAEVVVLPTPPFPEVITITSLIGTSSCILFYHFILL